MLMLGNDLVINENDCNQSCEYCLTGQSNLKREHEQQLIFQTPKRDTYAKDSPLAIRLNTIVERTQRRFRTPFLKISGGEVFLVKNILDFVELMTERHEVVVLQTNAMLLVEEHVERLSKLKNLVVQVSLDSHLHPGNSYRIQDARLHAKAIAKIERLLSTSLNVEIYAVLTDRNVEGLVDFAQWLMQFDSKPVLFPFPARGPEAVQYAVRADQVGAIERFIDEAEPYWSVLPPRAYLVRLNEFMRAGERRFRCHLPRIVFSTFGDGILTACPNIWFNDMGNVAGEEWAACLEKVGQGGIYPALLGAPPRLEACKRCFTPWDLLSMYFDSDVSLDEICATPSYRSQAIRELLIAKKHEYLGQEHE